MRKATLRIDVWYGRKRHSRGVLRAIRAIVHPESMTHLMRHNLPKSLYICNAGVDSDGC
jgi:hypothetical protein